MLRQRLYLQVIWTLGYSYRTLIFAFSSDSMILFFYLALSFSFQDNVGVCWIGAFGSSSNHHLLPLHHFHFHFQIENIFIDSFIQFFNLPLQNNLLHHHHHYHHWIYRNWYSKIFSVDPKLVFVFHSDLFEFTHFLSKFNVVCFQSKKGFDPKQQQ